jgi:lipopolysaccharide transport system permease protein
MPFDLMMTSSEFDRPESVNFPAGSGLPHTHIEPEQGRAWLKLGELWEYRQLLYFLTWRDIKVRYKQSVLGIGWAVLQPFLTMLIFTFVFSVFANVSSGEIPYPIFAYTALLPWQYFATALNRSGVSVVGNAHLISKVYFPRLAIPLSAAIAPIVDFGIAFLLLIGMMFYYGIKPTTAILALPLFMLLAFVTALACSLWLAALNVRYRDVGHLIPFLIQAWMYLSPVAYPSSLVPEEWLWLYRLNPMAGVVDGFRWALLDGEPPLILPLLGSALAAILVLVTSLSYFHKTEETFADVI